MMTEEDPMHSQQINDNTLFGTFVCGAQSTFSLLPVLDVP